jgi:hypothetical protein
MMPSSPCDYISEALATEKTVAAKLSVYARTLQAASDILGGERALARYLRVSLPDLHAWLRPGSVAPPANVFLKAVDILLNDLPDAEAARAQKVRVAAAHNNWQDPV